jgi:hypothetical protein
VVRRQRVRRVEVRLRAGKARRSPRAGTPLTRAQLLVRAADCGLQTTSFRLGQICGNHDTGTWATTDWFALLMRSSVALGALPEATGVASWITPEGVSGALLDVALAPARPARALNAVHPRPIRWADMISAAADALVREGVTQARLPIVTASEWYAKLADVAAGADEARIKRIVRASLPCPTRACLIDPSQPAIKLLGYFRDQAETDAAARALGAHDDEAVGLVSLALEKVQAASATMRALEPLDSADVGRWVGYWHAKGLFEGVH